MKEWGRVFAAEALKLKRTPALWVACGAPLAVCLMFLAVSLKIPALPESYAGDAWLWFVRNISMFWSMMVFPMTIAMVSGLLIAFEHNALAWKHLFALPVHRSAVIATKYVAHHTLLAISTFTMILAIYGAGKLVHAVRPDFGFGGPVPLAFIVTSLVKFHLAAWLIVALLQWLAIQVSNFTITLAVGIVGTFAGMVSATGWFQKLWPWKLMLNTQAGTPGVPELALAIGFGGGLLVTVAAIVHLSRREIV